MNNAMGLAHPVVMPAPLWSVVCWWCDTLFSSVWRLTEDSWEGEPGWRGEISWKVGPEVKVRGNAPEVRLWKQSQVSVSDWRLGMWE